MKNFLLLAGMFIAVQGAYAQVPDDEGKPRKIVRMDTVTVTSTRASATTPMVHTNVGRDKIDAGNYAADIPFLLQFTPSVIATSDAGAGVGYTGIRIRGTDATRINVTANGIPMNDAESHGLFWVNTPDIASSMGSIQIQRGVGTSTNGAGAFGGSINMLSEPVSPHPFAEVSATYGSYNTRKESVRLGTGLLGDRWAFDLRLSDIHSDGYRERASTSMQSYFAQGAYYARNTTLRFMAFGGKERTYHAWDAIDAKTMKENRRYNPCGEIQHYVYDVGGVPKIDENGDLITTFAGYYEDQTDNYIQNNFQLHVMQDLSSGWRLNVGLHYTKGDGYYEEYKNGRSLKEYSLLPYSYKYTKLSGEVRDTTVTHSNLVRRKQMDNYFAGGVFSLDYISTRLMASLGGAANIYDGDHFGNVVWIQNYHGDEYLRADHEYYRNNGKKKDANVYLKANWEVSHGLHLYGDLQYRHIAYRIDGANDNWDWTVGAMQKLAVDESFNFFNPKGGVFWQIDDRWNVYGSVAVAHREPTRNNYTDAKTDMPPRSERLIDYEAGVNFRMQNFYAGANLYYMAYKDQLVLTGEVNHIGEPLAENISDSYRTGIEVVAGVRIAPWLRWDVNATLSRNRIENYTEYLNDVDEEGNSLWTQSARRVGDTDISYSPSVTGSSIISAEHSGFSVSLHTMYVGKQFVTNSSVDALSLDAYCVSNLNLSYTFRMASVESVRIGIAVNNIFNAKYSSNGYGWSDTNGRDRFDYMYYFPQATANILANITLRF